MSIIVLSRKRMCMTTTSVYLRMLAIADSLVLLGPVLRAFVYNYTFTDIRALSLFSCRVHNWLSNSSVGTSCWLLSIIAVDRLLSIKYPLWTKVHCTRKLSLIIGITVIVIIHLLGSHMLVFIGRKETYVTSKVTNITMLVNVKCTYGTDQYKSFHTKVWSVLILVLYSILPLVCLITCNIFLFRALSKRNIQELATSITNNAKNREQRDLKSMTKMLVVVCLFFICVTLPGAIYIIIRPYIFDITSKVDAALQLMCQTINACILYSNNTVNFFLYCLSGSLFRKEFCCMFKELKTYVLKRTEGRVGPAESQKDSKGTKETQKETKNTNEKEGKGTSSDNTAGPSS